MLQSASENALKNLAKQNELVDIFCKLVTFDTQALAKSQTVPSSAGQLELGAYLRDFLQNLGYETYIDDKGIVKTFVAASEGCENAKGLCLLAHLDTAPDASGKNVKPRLVEHFSSKEGIKLDNGLVIDSNICPKLFEHLGDDIIVTDGTTLLGADDKAGVAIIVKLLKTLKEHPEIKHGPLCAVFTVDEELGTSTSHIKPDEFKCEYGITIDGSNLGELDVATFNASKACVNFRGISVHTAVAYKAMVNATSLVAKFMSLLPSTQRPETTYGKEGFYHIYNIQGQVENACVELILRDFDENKLKEREDFVKECAKFINKSVGYEACSVVITPQYKNLAQALKANPEILDLCHKAFKDANVEVVENSVRGGTDGSNLSYRGLPCPNIFMGALNCHGPYECLPIKAFSKSYEITLALVKRMAETSK
ncbi:MAG: peptidase T [Succinatimonas sp.]|nr:peptidase T [Succinatimonas sp.]